MVLVVDDDADLRRLVKTYVENEGMICMAMGLTALPLPVFLRIIAEQSSSS